MGSDIDSGDNDIYIECSPVGTSDENVLTGIYKDKYIRLEDRIDRESNRVINKIKKILQKKSCSSDTFRGYREGNTDSCETDEKTDEETEGRASYLWRNTKIAAGVNCPRRIQVITKQLREKDVLTNQNEWGPAMADLSAYKKSKIGDWGTIDNPLSRRETAKKIRDEFCEGDNYCKYRYNENEGPLCISASESMFKNIRRYIKEMYKATVNENIDCIRGLSIGLISIIMFNKLLNKLENKSDIKEIN